MKKIIALIILFIIYAVIVNTCPAVTQWDRSVITAVQDMLKDLPVAIPDSAGGWLYKCGIYIPLIAGIVYFFRRYLLIDIVLFSSAPAVGYILNKFIIKNIIARPRPPFDMQLIAHKTSFSFTSNHTVVTSVLWGLVIYYLIKYCKNKILKICGITFSGFWIIFEGFSRVWLGVHNPTDVIGGYLLAIILLLVYIKLIRLIGGKC